MESSVPLSSTMSKLPASNSSFFASIIWTTETWKLKLTFESGELLLVSLDHLLNDGGRDVDAGHILVSVLEQVLGKSYPFSPCSYSSSRSRC